MKIAIKTRQILYFAALAIICAAFFLIYAKISEELSNHFAITQVHSNDSRVDDIIEEKFYGTNLLLTSFKDVALSLHDGFEFNYVKIAKYLPQTLMIDIINIEPSVFKKSHDKTRFYDLKGNIALQKPELLDLNDMIKISGDDAEVKFPEILNLCQSYGLDVKHLQFIDQRRWNLTLKHGLLIKLPKENFKDALLSLPKIINSVNLNDEIVVVDLSAYPQKIYLKKNTKDAKKK